MGCFLLWSSQIPMKVANYTSANDNLIFVIGYFFYEYTNVTSPRMHLFHIPQYSIQNRNVHISVPNGALWEMEQVHSGICELGQFYTDEFVSTITMSGVRRNRQGSASLSLCAGNTLFTGERTVNGGFSFEMASNDMLTWYIFLENQTIKFKDFRKCIWDSMW